MIQSFKKFKRTVSLKTIKALAKQNKKFLTKLKKRVKN